MNKTDKVKNIISLLESVLNNELKASEAIDRWPDIDQESDDLLKKTWHELYHFYADEDIRVKDQDYDKYQRDLLNRCMSEIRNKFLKD